MERKEVATDSLSSPPVPTESPSPASTNLDSSMRSIIVKSTDGKKHKMVYDSQRSSIQFTLIGQNHHLTDKSLVLPINNILCLCSTKLKRSSRSGLPIRSSIESSNKDEKPNIIFIYYIYRTNVYTLRIRKAAVVFSTTKEKKEWMELLSENLSAVSIRPKTILVFINPFGGKGNASIIWEEQVEPLFKLAGIDYEVIRTKEANHASECVKNLEQNKWRSIDGIISVGGDGLFNEVLSSVTIRTQKESGKNIHDANISRLETPRISFGIIGAGSANSIVASVHGVDDCPTAALHIILGSKCYVDVCTVHEQHKLLRFSANAISYGWLGDTLHNSERYRFMGPIRYQWSALLTSIRHPTHFGQVSFEISHKKAQQSGSDQADDQQELLPSKLPPCSENCQTCERKIVDPQYPYHWQTDFTHVISCVNRCISPFTPYGLAPFANLGDGSMDLAMIPTVSRIVNLKIMSKVALYGGRFIAKSERDLNVYRVLRWKFTPKALLAVEQGHAGMDEPDHNNNTDETEEFEGAWNVDGEILKQPAKRPLFFRLHPRLITFFGGDVDFDDPRYQRCFGFCSKPKKYSKIVLLD